MKNVIFAGVLIIVVIILIQMLPSGISEGISTIENLVRPTATP